MAGQVWAGALCKWYSRQLTTNGANTMSDRQRESWANKTPRWMEEGTVIHSYLASLKGANVISLCKYHVMWQILWCHDELTCNSSVHVFIPCVTNIYIDWIFEMKPARGLRTCYKHTRGANLIYCIFCYCFSALTLIVDVGCTSKNC